jgi:transcriptional regulator with XRE-family HTH domain
MVRIDKHKLFYLMAKRGVTLSSIANVIGKSDSALSKSLSRHSYTESDLLLLASALNLSFDDFTTPDVLEALKPRHGQFALSMMTTLRDVARIMAEGGRTLDVEGAAETTLLEHEAALLEISRALRAGEMPCTREAVSSALAHRTDEIVRNLDRRLRAGEHDV